jgi:hypothetical protein
MKKSKPPAALATLAVVKKELTAKQKKMVEMLKSSRNRNTRPISEFFSAFPSCIRAMRAR